MTVSRGRTVRGDHCCMLKSGVLFKRHTFTCTRNHAHSVTHDQEEVPHLYPRRWQQPLPQDRDQFNFKHQFSLDPALFSGLLTVSLAACLSQLAINSFVLLFFSAKEPGTETKAGRMKKGKSDMRRKPQCFLNFSRQRGGPQLLFPSADFRLVRPAPAITYIPTTLLTTGSTPNYHVPSMTILQAHPQVQRCCYLKTRQRPTTTTSAAFETP